MPVFCCNGRDDGLEVWFVLVATVFNPAQPLDWNLLYSECLPDDLLKRRITIIDAIELGNNVDVYKVSGA